MLRDVALAFTFGTDSALAAFLVAFRFAHLLRRLLGEGAFQTAFIPKFEELRAKSPLQSGRFFIDLYAALSLFLFILIILVTIGCTFLLHNNILSEGNAEIVWLALLMLPSLLFICLFGLNASILQCERSYFLPAVAPVAFNVFWILGTLSLRGMLPAQAMPWLAAFINFACISQWLVTMPMTWRIVNSLNSSSTWNKINPFSVDVRRFCRPLFLGMLGVAAAQINSAFDAIFARYASSEGPAYLWYAIRFQQLPLGLIGIALAGALLPALSRAVQAGEYARFRGLLVTSLKKCVWMMLPMTAGMFLLGGYAITIVYGHGSFDAESIKETTHCLWGYAFGLLPMAAVLVLAPAFYARGEYWTTTLAAIASMAVNAVLSGWFVVGLGWGAPSVAVATSLSAWINCIWLAVALNRTLAVARGTASNYP